MALCWFLDPNSDRVITLSATQQFTISMSTKPTEYKIEDGSSVTDNIVFEKQRIRFNGVLGRKPVDIFRAAANALPDLFTGGSSQNLEPDYTIGEYQRFVEQVMTSKVTFTFWVDDEEAGLRSYDNCVITSVDISRDKSVSDGAKVNVSVEQLRFAPQAQQTTIELPRSGKDREQLGSALPESAAPTSRTNEEELAAVNEQIRLRTGGN